jgi:hypothetical protein
MIMIIMPLTRHFAGVGDQHGPYPVPVIRQNALSSNLSHDLSLPYTEIYPGWDGSRTAHAVPGNGQSAPLSSMGHGGCLHHVSDMTNGRT